MDGKLLLSRKELLSDLNTVRSQKTPFRRDALDSPISSLILVKAKHAKTRVCMYKSQILQCRALSQYSHSKQQDADLPIFHHQNIRQ